MEMILGNFILLVRRVQLVTFVLFIAVALSIIQYSYAMPANPMPYKVTQPDETVISLRLYGDEYRHWQEDIDGYTVIEENGKYFYTQKDGSGGLTPSNLEVGKVDPQEWALSKHMAAHPTGMFRQKNEQSNSLFFVPLQAGDVPNKMENLVVLIRFADHRVRVLPSPSDINILFNQIGGHPTLAPAGSIKDIYLTNSNGAFTIDSTVVAWVTSEQTEAYWASGNSGLSTQIHGLLKEALNTVDLLIDFRDFDQNNDGEIDAITFLHSGFAAEFGGVDCYSGATITDRIWSHKWSFPAWRSAQGISVSSYNISSALWGTCGASISHAGVIIHEMAHMLGLPDLYDGSAGQVDNVIGSWGVMSNAWGADYSQQPPPLMSAWSKLQLGWIQPTYLSESGHYQISGSNTYTITEGYPAGEYLLLERRMREDLSGKVIDNIPVGGNGMAIWHIDQSAPYIDEGYPSQSGWPENGRHYRVALLQADSHYDLEKGNNLGDSTDTYRNENLTVLAPETVPNSDAYQNGNIYATGHRISNISAADYSMSFDYNIASSDDSGSGGGGGGGGGINVNDAFATLLIYLLITLPRNARKI